jgi:FixJ family two-component response regulator
MRDAAPVVCLVDDDESVRRSIVRVLGSLGFEVQAFSEPDAFLRHLRMHSVPVAILDIWMDHMTGWNCSPICARDHLTRVVSSSLDVKIMPLR